MGTPASLFAMSFGAYGMGTTNRHPVLDEGRITAFDAATGLCKVDTSSGRTLTAVRPLEGMSGPRGGNRVTPLVGARCLVVFFMPDPTRGAYVVGTFETPDSQGSTGSWGAAGDSMTSLGSGGHILVDQEGNVDVAPNPWCRLTMMGAEQTVKGFMKKLDLGFTPLSTFRLINDDEAEAGFIELNWNSRFMHRDGDITPDVSFTIGAAHRSPLASTFANKDGWLFHAKIEERGDGSGEPLHTYTHGVGGVNGRTSVRHSYSADTDLNVREEVGGFEDLAYRLSVAEGEEEKARYSIDGTGSHLLWNTETEISVHEDKIDIGRGTLHPMVFGDTLEELLTAFINELLRVQWATMMGPSVPGPVNPAPFISLRARLAEFKSLRNSTV